MNVCEFTLYEYSWKRGERIPRDITCIYSRVFYRQVSVHVSVHAAKKRRKKKKDERIVEANRSGIDSPRETDPLARREAWYRFLGSRKRVVRATARDQRHLHTERNRRLSKSFVYISRRPSGKTRGSRDCRRPLPPPSPIWKFNYLSRLTR